MSLIKILHISFALLSITGFSYRSSLKLSNPTTLQRKWLKITPHIIDTLLLASAIYLVIASGLYPVWFNWVMAKITALILYILFGLYTLRFSKTRRQVILGFLLSLITFSYIVCVAITKQPWPLML
ncbi:MAG: SirB2 family protein [Thioalkalispiraceae bacterium]|jgi:uncharacterized membrane protein SirB2